VTILRQAITVFLVLFNIVAWGILTTAWVLLMFGR
jgi:hypothetical protein